MIETSKTFWERIYSQNIKKMIGICYRYTSNQEIAEDLAHDAFVIAMEKSSSYEGKGPFEAWLRRIVVNVSLGFLREQSKKSYLNDLLSKNEDSMEVLENSENQEFNNFTTEELFNIINQLPEHHKLVFNLYVIDKFTHAQIGKELGISEGTSKSHLARARKRIKALLLEKIHADTEKQNRMFLLFVFPLKLWNTDRLFQKRFKNFEIGDRNPLNFDLSEHAKSISNFKPSTGFLGTNLSTAIVSLLVGTGILVTLYPRKAPSTSEIKQEKYSAQKNKEENKFDSSSATIPQTPIMLNGNELLTSTIDTMKKSEILGALLVASTSLALPVNAQSTVNASSNASKQASVSVNAKSSASADAKSSVILNSKNGESVRVNVKPKINSDPTIEVSGTFYGEKLNWSADNNELHFEGRSIVSFGENNFVSSGSSSFLGKVYYLVINGEPAKLGAKIKLSEKKYSLTRLSAQNALTKYGEVGSKGAIEIALVE